MRRSTVYAEQEIKRQLSEVNKIELEIANLYQDSEQQFLKETTDEESITELKDKVFQIRSEAQEFNLEKNAYTHEFSTLSASKKKLTQTIQQMSNQKRIQTSINQVVLTPITVWSGENHIVMKENTEHAVIQQLYQEISEYNSSVWKDKVLIIVSQLLEQVNYYIGVTKSVEEMENKILLNDGTLDEVLVLYDQVSEIRNDTLRSALSVRLDKIYNQLIGEASTETETSESPENLE